MWRLSGGGDALTIARDNHQVASTLRADTGNAQLPFDVGHQWRR
jgi:hypothetical protein